MTIPNRACTEVISIPEAIKRRLFTALEATAPPEAILRMGEISLRGDHRAVTGIASLNRKYQGGTRIIIHQTRIAEGIPEEISIAHRPTGELESACSAGDFDPNRLLELLGAVNIEWNPAPPPRGSNR